LSHSPRRGRSIASKGWVSEIGQREGRIDDRYATAWLDILDRPVPEVRRALSADSPRMRDLRQSSPFAGTLTEAERRKIFAEIR
jgi:hypothetical protein